MKMATSKRHPLEQGQGLVEEMLLWKRSLSQIYGSGLTHLSLDCI